VYLSHAGQTALIFTISPSGSGVYLAGTSGGAGGSTQSQIQTVGSATIQTGTATILSLVTNGGTTLTFSQGYVLIFRIT
jgi:hypothetical protein